MLMMKGLAANASMQADSAVLLAPPDRLVIVDEFRTSRVSLSVHARQPCELHLLPDQPRPADWVPPAGQVNHRLLRPAWSLRHAKCVRGLKWCHEVPPNPPPPPPAPLAQDPPPPAQALLAQEPPAQDPPPPAQAQPLPVAPGPVPPPQAPPWGRWLDRDTTPCLNFQRIGESKQRPLELCSWTDLEALPQGVPVLMSAQWSGGLPQERATGVGFAVIKASRLLGVHATSAASERNWSAWGRLFTSARTRLTLERAKMLIYIKANAGLGARRSNEAQLLARMGE
ncbi:hypothetical protein QJQ45_026466 [Haematococcus lacustris]|nr:hypothetical protein QJQ45_026466 [Haematococcus lacustris]